MRNFGKTIMLSVLQQELFDLMSAWCKENWSYVVNKEEDIEVFIESLREDIKKMDAIDLRSNISSWKEDL